MRPRPPSDDHQATVARRLASLSAELAAMRPSSSEPGPAADASPVGTWEDGVTPSADPLSEHTRIRETAPRVLARPLEVREPGKHRERRRATLLPSPTHLAVLAAVVAVGMGLTTWLLVGGRAREVTPPPVEATFSAATAHDSAQDPPGEASEASVPSAEVTVDVAGKVRRPGIAVLPSGSRVVDAIAAAGGARRGVDLSQLNLARVLVDGEQILVGLPAPTGVADLAGSGPPGPTGALVNINTADQATLETLPGVGPVTAGAILAWRADHGAFTAVEELVEVDGIGEATLATLAPLVTV